ENKLLNNITNVEFICNKVEDEIDNLLKKTKIDVLIVDPSRKGCDIKFLEAIIKADIKKIVYVSCNPSTFARDLKVLHENNYKLIEVTPVDMFSHTSHVECVCLVVKNNIVRL
ncbi:MAG: 23S rRNA (uracil(1939)-C(5))-methyltransferase RlmD, partial [Anaeroplasmataceae bacterium]